MIGFFLASASGKKRAITLAFLLLAFSGCTLPEGPVTSTSVGTRQTSIPTKTLTPTQSPATETVEQNATAERDHRVVIKVIDGDTIDVSRPGGTDKERVRLIGVDTPETKDPRKPVQCFGQEAAAFTGQLKGRTVWLEYDIQKTDRYGRTLAYVFLDDGAFFNLILVEEGYAQPMTIPPNVKYSEQFLEASRSARDAGRGLWGKCR